MADSTVPKPDFNPFKKDANGTNASGLKDAVLKQAGVKPHPAGR
jgi:hypothetical protein